jgi:hypothetical protein
MTIANSSFLHWTAEPARRVSEANIWKSGKG